MSIRKTLFFLILVIFNSSCQKYEQDEFISLKSPNKRILGSWELKSLMIDGKDSTKEALDFICGHNLKFLTQAESNGGSTALILENGYCNKLTSGAYWFSDFKTTIFFNLVKGGDTSNNVDYVGAFCEGKRKWSIKKLTSKELKLESSKDGWTNQLQMIKK